MWQNLKTAILVVIITVVIWGFAEAESLKRSELRGASVTFQPEPGSNWVVKLGDAGAGNSLRADIYLEGSAAAVDSAERELRTGFTLTPGSEGVPAAPGRHTVDLETAIRAIPSLKARGISVPRVDPQTVEVILDELVTRAVRVDLDITSAELDGARDSHDQPSLERGRPDHRLLGRYRPHRPRGSLPPDTRQAGDDLRRAPHAPRRPLGR
jgi:hypothetical protein